MAEGVGADPARIITVPNAVDVDAVDRAAAGARADRDGYTIGWVGTFGEWHGAEVLIEALSRLRDDSRLLMVGDGTTRPECEELAAALGVAGRIEFAGRLHHDAAIARLAECDVLASPTVPLRGGQPFFGSPTKLFEYMALERPIVASRLGQIGEVLEDGVNARLVAPGDAAELAAALDELRADPELASGLARRAREDAESRHGWSDRAEAILAALSAA
jgi:glycosyltransferase involved in cell wall biosynthesis